jgi:hypothetical protein
MAVETVVWRVRVGQWETFLLPGLFPAARHFIMKTRTFYLGKCPDKGQKSFGSGRAGDF